ncbi:hypothetical protein AX16_001294 [Volvariella volvacea WC 439]|nr:hypothetical protein AX16_001294 [Volvariella volvacea WC 439]
MKLYTRFTRSLLNHALTKAFQQQFFLDKPRHCPRCGEFQNRWHIIFACLQAITNATLNIKLNRLQKITASDLNKHFMQRIKKSKLVHVDRKIPSVINSYFEWLELNGTAFTFEEGPLDLSR